MGAVRSPDNMKRPTGPTCDGCHSVDYNIHTKQVAEWNVGCERCHGPGSEHSANPTRANIPTGRPQLRPGQRHLHPVPFARPPAHRSHRGNHYDWPVGYRVGLNLQDFWKLEDHTLGATTFTHYADGTAHKNRMQGNDFVQSVMYRRGITCFTCHDVTAPTTTPSSASPPTNFASIATPQCHSTAPAR